MDRERAMAAAVTIVIAVSALGVGGLIIHEVATDSGLQEYAENSQEWCDERNGTLVNSRVIGEHGGLHCEFDNGTSVHMHEIEEVQPDDG